MNSDCLLLSGPWFSSFRIAFYFSCYKAQYKTIFSIMLIILGYCSESFEEGSGGHSKGKEQPVTAQGLEGRGSVFYAQ